MGKSGAKRVLEKSIFDRNFWFAPSKSSKTRKQPKQSETSWKVAKSDENPPRPKPWGIKTGGSSGIRTPDTLLKRQAAINYAGAQATETPGILGDFRLPIRICTRFRFSGANGCKSFGNPSYRCVMHVIHGSAVEIVIDKLFDGASYGKRRANRCNTFSSLRILMFPYDAGNFFHKITFFGRSTVITNPKLITDTKSKPVYASSSSSGMEKCSFSLSANTSTLYISSALSRIFIGYRV